MLTLNRCLSLAIGLAVLSTTAIAASAPARPDPVTSLKQSIHDNQLRLRKYEWVETTAVNLKGEEKSRKQNQCYYDVEGKEQKVPIASAAPQAAPKRGLRGRIVAKKTEELTDYMKQAVALIHAYVPPDSELIAAAKAGGKVATRPGPGNAISVEITDYRLQGDVVTFEFDARLGRILHVRISTYLETPQDTITLDVAFSALPDGTNHPGMVTLNAPAKDIRVVVENSGYRPGR